MPLNKPTFIDDVPVNGLTGIELWLSKGGDGYSLENTLRRRADYYPDIESYSQSERRIPFSIKPTAQWLDGVEAFDSYIRGLLRVSSRSRVLTSERGGVTYTINVLVVDINRSSVNLWAGNLLLLEPEWMGPTIGPVSINPLDVEGNIDTRPIIRLSNGAAALRRRVSIRDTTGDGIASWPIAVDVSIDALAGNNYIVYFEGVPVPFWYVSDHLFFRVAARIGVPSFVDIIASASINNDSDVQTAVDGKDNGGLALNTNINSAAMTVDASTPWANPDSAALAFHAAIAGSHNNSRSYTFGYDGDGKLRLVDAERSGRKWELKNDADALVLASPVEMTSISNLTMEAFVGFRPGKSSSKQSTRVMRVTIQDANGQVVEGPNEDHTYVLLMRTRLGAERWKNRNYSAVFNFGGISFPNFRVHRDIPVDEEVMTSTGDPTNTYWKSGTGYQSDYMPSEFGALAAKHIGCPVTNGAAGEWFLHFPDDAYGGLNIPYPTMSIQPKSGRVQVSTFTQPVALFVDYSYGDTSLDNILIMNAEWVDPDTLEPLDNQSNPAPEHDIYGRISVYVAYWTRDSENPNIAYETQLSGANSATGISVPNATIVASPDGLTYTITPPAMPIPGAVKVAIGLAPAATAPNQIDWGTLEVTSDPAITLDATQRPALTQTNIQGQILDGTLRNLVTGEYIALGDCYSDTGGLEIDCQRLTIRGVSGIGMVYGEIRPSGGIRWFDLPVGDINWEASGGLATATISFEYNPRLIGNS